MAHGRCYPLEDVTLQRWRTVFKQGFSRVLQKNTKSVIDHCRLYEKISQKPGLYATH